MGQWCGHDRLEGDILGWYHDLLRFDAQANGLVLLRLMIRRLFMIVDEIGRNRRLDRNVGVLSNHDRMLLSMLQVRVVRRDLRSVLLQQDVGVGSDRLLVLRVNRLSLRSFRRGRPLTFGRSVSCALVHYVLLHLLLAEQQRVLQLESLLLLFLHILIEGEALGALGVVEALVPVVYVTVEQGGQFLRVVVWLGGVCEIGAIGLCEFHFARVELGRVGLGLVHALSRVGHVHLLKLVSHFLRTADWLGRLEVTQRLRTRGLRPFLRLLLDHLLQVLILFQCRTPRYVFLLVLG